MTAKYSKQWQSCARPNSHTHTKVNACIHTHTQAHHEPKSMMPCCRQQIWRDGEKSIYDTQCSIFSVHHVRIFQTGTPNQTFACVLLGRQYEPLTSRRMTGVTWGHRLPYNGAVIRGSTCALPWPRLWLWAMMTARPKTIRRRAVWGSVCSLGAVSLQRRRVEVGSMPTAAHGCKDLLLGLVEKVSFNQTFMVAMQWPLWRRAAF